MDSLVLRMPGNFVIIPVLRQRSGNRLDYAGGKEENRFYLKNNAELPEYLK